MIAGFVSFCLIAVAAGVGILVFVLSLEIIAAVTLSPRRIENDPTSEARPRTAVLVPAHNEGMGLLPTLTDIKKQLLPGDRLIVIADNCVDDTAAVASAAGAEMIKRDEPERIGKGFALDYGLRHLDLDAPDVVIVIDADCRISQGSIDLLIRTCAAMRRPVQALDLMISPDPSRLQFRVAEFAWRVKNWVRPLGLSALHLPCQLMGTGMAFPWKIIRSADLARGLIVEDLQLGLDLAHAGVPAMFCPSACVMSEFPSSMAGAASQRQRWEQGHISTISKFPAFMARSIKQRDFASIVLTLDLAIPPLSLLVFLLVGMVILTGTATIAGVSPAALTISTANMVLLSFGIFLSWIKFGRDLLPLSSIFSVLPYIFSKLPIYVHALSGKIVSKWVRTDRKKIE